MKNFVFLWLLSIVLILSGCDWKHNFMDIDNPNAKEDLQYYIGKGKILKINSDDFVPDSLSGVLNDTKGQASIIYENNLKGYVDIAKKGLSGAAQELKGYYNSGVDELNGIIIDKVNSAISEEMNKFKIK